MSTRKRSDVWTHFVATEAKCNICKNSFSTKAGSTSNWRRHLKSSHPTVLLAQVRTETEDDSPAAAGAVSTTSTSSAGPSTALAGMLTTSTTSSTPAPTTIQGPVRPRRSQQQTSMSSFVTRPMDPLRQSKLDEALVRMIACDFQPFSIVEDKGFKEYSHLLDPSYSLPSRKTLSKTVMPRLYDKLRGDIMDKIKSASAVCLTTDCWTSLTTESYMTVTCHFIEDFQMTSYLLDCFVLTERHTAAHLANNASNIVSALKDHLHWDHIPCFAHMLNLIVGAALKEVQAILQKVKTTVEYFHRSTVASDKLKATQTQMGQEMLRLKQDVATRWNSTYYMLKRFSEIKDPIISTLALTNASLPTLSPEEWKISREILDIIKPFEEVTTEVSAEKFVTASEVILMTRGLHRIVTRYQRNPSSSVPVKRLVDSLMLDMTKRFGKVEHIEKLADATCLDPRFKKQAFVNQQAAEETVKRVTAAAAAINPAQSEEENTSDPGATASAGAMFWEDFDERVASLRPSASTSKTSDAMMEMRAYLAEPLLSRTSDPLSWWSSCSPVYNTLSEVMKARLCIVATSVPSERIFSKTGQIISERRNRLSPSNVREFVF
ncbi:putative zinc finger BED domain-containing protein 1-like [Triplophysa rosa]|uniref:Zinc finger BED domain-containing protein 1-like n=1 Tax=Triplophysa rosa TaxID=992332 RepID=A0A9W7WBM1_TRIRA|nr:putative zinc finger BED domain-containing protein 1-like [Triplophysa rosa]